MNLNFIVYSALFLMLEWSVCYAAFNTSELDTASSLKFESPVLFATGHWIVHHMELDLFNDDGSILYIDSYKLKVSNGSATSVVYDFRGPIGGFKQLNSTTVVVSVNMCIQMFDRVTGTVRTIAGGWGNSGYINGIPGMFKSTGSIVLDQRNSNRILVVDSRNYAIRAIDLLTGRVSTIAKGGFYPRSMAWYNDQLLFTENLGVRKIMWNERGQPIVSRVVGRYHRFFDYLDGSFLSAVFDSPKGISRISDNHYLVADFDNDRIRLLDMNRKVVLPVCFGTSICREGTVVPNGAYSVLMVDDTIYLGGFLKIMRAKRLDG